MQSILVPITNERDVSFIMDFLKRIGIKAMVIDEDVSQMKARKSMISLSRKIKKNNISDIEIIEEIKAYRKSKHDSK
ncbi:MAG: hypothetical protein A2033_05835 [Bacteroidetes bacterium GWA2_31_9]|nr:MAG: hypothetical protein A2033_05835 [Bacteroidetes bacterium GWA2_31_9]